MGTWSSAPFGNDIAKDWVWRLEKSQGAELLSETVQRCLKWKSQVDAPVAAEAVAAAAVIAATASEPVRGVSAEIKSWIRTQGYVPTRKLIADAKRALRRVMDDSELRDLWDERHSLDLWTKATAKVIDNLQAAEEKELPKRKPGKPGMPRSLCKLLERYDSHASDAVRERISRKIGNLKDPNAQTRDTGYRQPLSLAAARGFIEEVNMLLDQGADPSGDDNAFAGHAPFVEACAGNHLDVAEVLRKAGAEIFSEVHHDAGEGFLGDVVLHQMEVRGITPKQKGDTYCMALFVVARRGSPTAADYLVGHGADLEQTDLNGESLLHKAAEGGNLPMLRYLVEAGLYVDVRKGTHAETPLHFAVGNNNYEGAKILLEKGADPNSIESFNGREHHWRRTPLDNVDGSNKKKIVALLKKYGGKPADDIPE